MRFRLAATLLIIGMLTACSASPMPKLKRTTSQIVQQCPPSILGGVIWADDSTHLAYDFNGNPYVLTISETGKSSSKGINAEASPFAFSPDGSHLLLSTPEGAQLVNMDGSDLTDLPPEMFLQSYGGSWSPDGTRIAFARFNAAESRYELAVLEVISGTVRAIYAEPTGDLLLRHPAWSPDGTRIAVSEGQGHPRGYGWLQVITVDNPDEVLTIDKKSYLPPAWSPDGKYIAVMDWGDDSGIYILNADGSGRTRLTDEPAATMRWLPDSSGLAAVSMNISTGRERVIRVTVSGEITRLSELVLEGSVSISPDGTRIAYLSSERGFDDLYLMNVDGTQKDRLTVNSAYSKCIEWPF